jgi:predicted ArsR family transcriptional regulator
LLRTAFEAAAERVAAEHKDEVAAPSLEGRVAETSEALQREGIVDRWEKQPDGYHLSNSACPYRQAALTSTGPCELDRRTIELLVAAPVRQVSRIADGKPACEYVVAERETRDAGQAVARDDSLAREA